MQTKKHSMIESIANVVVGYFVALASQIVIFPFFGIHVTVRDNIYIGLWFTVISILRSYALRRLFTHKTEKGEHK
jgi:hypothetical protein